MTNETKITEKNTEPKNYAAVSELWGTMLGTVEAWKIGRANLAKWLDEQEKLPFGAFFETKSVKNTGDFSSLALAIMTHTTTGNIDAKYKSVKMRALEAGNYDKQACVESFILDILAPNLAEERAKKEKERAERRAERLNLHNSVAHAIDAVKDTWEDAGLIVTEELVKKACERKLDKYEATFAKAFTVELAGSELDRESARAICNELGVDYDHDGLPEIEEGCNLV